MMYELINVSWRLYTHKCFQNRRCSFILLWFSLKENQNMAKNNIQRRKQLTMDKPHHFIAYGSTYTSWQAGRVLNRHTPPRESSWEGSTEIFLLFYYLYLSRDCLFTYVAWSRYNFSGR